MKAEINLELSEAEEATYNDDPVAYTKPKSQFILGAFLIATSLLGLSFAANLTLGSGDRLEFGQGIYRITSCDQWIGIKLNPTAASYSGQSRVANMNISGFDALNCRGVNFQIRLLNSSDTVLPLFRDGSGLVDRVLLNVSSDQSKTRANAVSFYDGYGVLVTSSLSGSNGYAYDSYQYLSYNSTTGVYTMVFSYPQATMSAVSSLSVQSQNAN